MHPAQLALSLWWECPWGGWLWREFRWFLWWGHSFRGWTRSGLLGSARCRNFFGVEISQRWFRWVGQQAPSVFGFCAELLLRWRRRSAWWGERIPRRCEKLIFPSTAQNDSTFWMKGYRPWATRCTRSMSCRQYRSQSWLRRTRSLNRHRLFWGSLQLWWTSPSSRSTQPAGQHWCSNRRHLSQPVHPVSSSRNAEATSGIPLPSWFCPSHCRSCQSRLCSYSSWCGCRSARCSSQWRCPSAHSETRTVASFCASFLYTHKDQQLHCDHLQPALPTTHILF